MTSTWPLTCWNSMHIHNNLVLHYLYNVAVGLVIYSKARALKAKAKKPRPRMNIRGAIAYRLLCGAERVYMLCADRGELRRAGGGQVPVLDQVDDGRGWDCGRRWVNRRITRRVLSSSRRRNGPVQVSRSIALSDICPPPPHWDVWPDCCQEVTLMWTSWVL